MTPIDRVADRYRKDAGFHAVVDSLRSCIEQLQLTPDEVREAAMFACVMVEERRARPLRVLIGPEPPTAAGHVHAFATDDPHARCACGVTFAQAMGAP